MLLSLLPLSSPCGEDTATGGTTQCYKAKLKGMCAEKNSWVRSRCSATCCGIAVDANAVAEAKANLCADDIKLKQHVLQQSVRSDHTIAAAETQFAALAEQIRSFQTEHALPACR